MNLSSQASGNESFQGDNIAWNVLEAADDGIAITNEHGLVAYLNEAAEHILGLSFADALGEPISQTLALRPLGSQLSLKEADFSDEFDAQLLKGLFRLCRRNTSMVVSIQVSEITNTEQLGKEYVFIIRKLHDNSGLTNLLKKSAQVTSIPAGAHRRITHTLPPKERASVRFSLTYLILDELSFQSDAKGPSGTKEDAFDEAFTLIEKLVPSNGELHKIGNGESVLFMEESGPISTIEVVLRLIDVVRAKFQLSAKRNVRLGLSAGVLILPSNSSHRNTSLMVETARHLCSEARQLGNNAIQVCDLNSQALPEQT